jgi:hypothetical protein
VEVATLFAMTVRSSSPSLGRPEPVESELRHVLADIEHSYAGRATQASRGASTGWLRQARRIGLIPLLILVGAGIPFAVYLTAEQSASTAPEVLESTTLPVSSNEPSYGPLPGPAAAPRSKRNAPDGAGAGGSARRSTAVRSAPPIGAAPATSLPQSSAPSPPVPAPAPPAQGGASPTPPEKPAAQDTAPAKPAKGGGGFFDDSG